MIILESLDKISDQRSPFVLTIGNFDGVHLGHQKLLTEVKTNEGLKSLVVTFEPHPVEYFDRNKTFKKLFPASYQNEHIGSLGIDYLLRMKFDQHLATMSYDEFLNFFVQHLSIKKIVIGHDLKIGKDRKGDRAAIRSWCQKSGIQFQIVEPLEVKGQVISSTFIKTLIDRNRFEELPKFLGRLYSTNGTVVHGDKRGRLIGFPTANLTYSGSLYLPQFGVYQTRTSWRDRRCDSITNIGKTPTFKSDELVKIETHLFDFNEDIYGEKITVEFLKFIRSEQKFSGIEEIKRQIALDVASLGRDKKI
ncbi:MAG: bifunctional riboflavin kinase/FAD synthetase [Bdellovibrionaceae bacterium]|nr:bifunctional riboflavin kinase/FAD synthetase [Pseudobdellovibrionaceae bacterium]